MTAIAEYARFLELSADDRRDVFDVTAARLGITGTNVEKDFWVCYTLAALMKCKPTMPKRYFKGGTSLSKGYGLIERFSEDIDIVLARPGLFQHDAKLRGLPDPFDPDVEFVSEEDRKAAQKEVFKAAQRFVYGPLKDSLGANLPGVRIVNDKSKSTQPTLLVWYPSVYPAAADDEPEYNKRRIKIETGPRGATEPTSNKLIRPYVQEDLGALFELTVHGVTMIRAERTFLEKVSAIHQLIRKFEVEGVEPRIEQPPSRHLYDDARMMQKGVGSIACVNRELIETVCKDSQKTFPSPYTAEILSGEVKLVPPNGLRPLLVADYERMQGMFYGAEAPALDDIYEQLRRAEVAINATMKAGR